MRKLALFVGALTAFTLVKPAENLIGYLHGIGAPTTAFTLATTIGATAFVSIESGVGLLFFFALSRDNGTLHVSRRLRSLGRVIALLSGIMLAADLPKRISALINDGTETMKLDWWSGRVGIWSAMRDPFTVASITILVNLLLNALSIALLIALSRDPTDEPSEEIPVGRLLRVVSEMIAKIAGLVVIFAVIELLLIPYNFSVLRQYSYQRGRIPPRFTDLLVPQVRTVLVQFFGFVTFFIVYRGSRTEEKSELVMTDEQTAEIEEPPEIADSGQGPAAGA